MCSRVCVLQLAESSMTSLLSSLFEMPFKIVDAGLRSANLAIGTGQAGCLQFSGDSLFPTPSSVIESSLLTMNAVLKMAHSSVDALAGQTQRQPLKGAPLDGPQDIDTAVSDFANRLARMVRFKSWETADLNAGFREVTAAAGRSFGYVDLRNPSILVFPVQLMLSVGTLFIQQGLRGLATFELVGAQRYPRFLSDFFESFTDIPVFVGLEYRELIAGYEERLARAPGNDALRAELGHTQIKCGLYEAAASNLLQAANNPSVRATALHDAAVALHREGKLEDAAKVGSESLRVSPSNERARAWLWLTAHKMGGYPEFIPASQRMEMKVGLEKSTVEFEDIAARIGLDKTSGGRGLAVF